VSRNLSPFAWIARIRGRLHVRWPRFEVVLIVGVALVAFVITLVAVASASGARAKKAAQVAPPETVSRASAAALRPEDLGISADDFMLPTVAAIDGAEHYEPFRPRLQKWSPALIARYWIPPRQIATEIVSSLNDQNMRQLFEKVP